MMIEEVADEQLGRGRAARTECGLSRRGSRGRVRVCCGRWIWCVQDHRVLLVPALVLQLHEVRLDLPRADLLREPGHRY